MRTNREKSNHYLEKAEGDLKEQVYARGTLQALLAVAYAIHAMADDLEGQDRVELAILVEEQEEEDGGAREAREQADRDRAAGRIR